MDTGRFRLLAVLLLLTLLAGCSRSDIYDYVIDRERRLAGLAVQQVTIGEHRVVYLTNDRETGRETLVLVHGFGGNKDNWVRMAAHLSSDYNLVIPDLIGHGDSSVGDDDDYTIEAQSELLTALMDALDTGPVHMAGNSMGGGITAWFASHYGERVRSIALYDPAGSSRYPSELDRQLAAGNNPLVVREPGDFRQLMDFVLEQKPYVPGILISVMEQDAIARQQVLDEVFEAILGSSEDTSLESVLGGIPVPALVVWGREDRVLHPDNAQVFESLIPDARRVMLDGVGHVPMLEVPEVSAELMREFVEEVVASRPRLHPAPAREGSAMAE